MTAKSLKRCTDAPNILHTPSILGVSSTFRTPSTERIRVLEAWILRVLVWAVLKAQILWVQGVHPPAVSIGPQNASSILAVSAVQNLQILRVRAVSRSTWSPNTASTPSTWSILSRILLNFYSQVLGGSVVFCFLFSDPISYEHIFSVFRRYTTQTNSQKKSS